MINNSYHRLAQLLGQIALFVAFAMLHAHCDKPKPPSDAPSVPIDMQNNLLPKLTNENLGDFKWLNTPKRFEFANGSLKVDVVKETDFFNNPEDSSVIATAPVLYKEMKGDFIATALVKPDFNSQWNAIALMLLIDNNNWIKFGFENSDATGKGIVSVVTKQVSDDSNGAVLSSNAQVWLKFVRKGDLYSMLWSNDGKDYKMARLSTLPPSAVVKIGVEFQSPVGDFASHELKYLEIVEATVKDMRKGI